MTSDCFMNICEPAVLGWTTFLSFEKFELNYGQQGNTAGKTIFKVGVTLAAGQYFKAATNNNN